MGGEVLCGSQYVLMCQASGTIVKLLVGDQSARLISYGNLNSEILAQIGALRGPRCWFMLRWPLQDVKAVFCTFLCTSLLAHAMCLESHFMYVVKVLSSLDCLYVVSLLF